MLSEGEPVYIKKYIDGSSHGLGIFCSNNNYQSSKNSLEGGYASVLVLQYITDLSS